MKESEPEKKINFLDLLIVITREKWFIIKTVFGITIIALIISLLWPVTFKSTSTFVPATQQQSPLGGLAGLAGNLIPLSFSTEGVNTESLSLILSSRSLRTRVIDEFNLMEEYGSSVLEEALMTLDSNTDISLVREGGFGFNPIIGIHVSVTDREPERAQQITAFYISYLDSVSNRIAEANTRDRFEIIKSRFEQNQRELELAEERFRDFQQQYGIIDIEMQSTALIQSLADVYAQRTELDIEINLLRSRVDQRNPELRSLLSTRSELDRVIRELTRKTENDLEFNFVPSLDEVPELGLQYMRLYRDVLVEGKIYETIFPQFVQQQMLVESTRRNFHIIDYAHLPTYKDGPKRAFIVLGGFFFSVILSLFIVLMRDYFREREAENDKEYERIMELRKNLTSWKK